MDNETAKAKAEYRVTTAQNPLELLKLQTEPGWVIAYGNGDDIPEGTTVDGLDGPWAGEAAAVIAASWACSRAWGAYTGDATDILDAIDEADEDLDHRMREWSRTGRWYAAVQVRVVERDAAVAGVEAAERDTAIARAEAAEAEAAKLRPWADRYMEAEVERDAARSRMEIAERQVESMHDLQETLVHQREQIETLHARIEALINARDVRPSVFDRVALARDAAEAEVARLRPLAEAADAFVMTPADARHDLREWMRAEAEPEYPPSIVRPRALAGAALLHLIEVVEAGAGKVVSRG